MPLANRPFARDLVLLSATLLSLVTPAPADTLSEDRVKAGFIYNFIKYTQWPGLVGNGNELRVCSPATQPLSGELRQLQGRPAQGQTIAVELGVRPENWKTCHVLFIPQDEARQHAATLEAVARLPLLTVADSPDFIDAGGMIGLKRIAGRIRFDIHLVHARRAGLVLSSQLLKLADQVKQ
jgi:hypothetical protein